MTRTLALVVVISVVTLALGSHGAGAAHEIEAASIVTDDAGASLNISHGGYYFYIQFTRVTVGDMWPMHGKTGASAAIENARFIILNGSNDTYGRYTHIIMWKNLTLSGMMGRYPLSLRVDFYAASRPYMKEGVSIDNHTLRYAVHISTTCPGRYVYLEHRIMVSGQSHYDVYSNAGHGWERMRKDAAYSWLNYSRHAEIGVGDGKRMLFTYGWSSDTGRALYRVSSSGVSVTFLYDNTGSIVQDPYAKMPFTFYVPEEIEHAVNYFMQHIYSVAAGIVIASLLIIAPALRRRGL